MTTPPPPYQPPSPDPSGNQPPQDPYGSPPPQDPYGALPPFNPTPYGSQPEQPGPQEPPRYQAMPPYQPPQDPTPPPYQGYAPQQPMGFGQPAGPPPDNYLVWTILATVLCCVPLGIPAIVFSTQVNTKWGMGDYAGAQDSSKKAKNFSIAAAITGFVGLSIYAVLLFIGAIASF